MTLLNRLRILLARLRLAPLRAAMERETEDEFRFHLDMETERLMHGGLAPEEARRRALASFGGVERHREGMRDGWQIPALDSVVRDVRYVIRSLSRAPAFSIAVIVTLAVGLTSGLAVYSVVDALLLRPLPYPGAERIHTLWAGFGDGRTYGLTEPEAIELPGRIEGVEHIGVWYPRPFNLMDGGEPRQINGVRASAGFFDVLGPSAAMGRRYGADRDVPGADDVVVLSDGFWRRHFGADSAVLGRRLRLDGRARTVIGIMGPEFRYPTPDTEIWVPLAIERASPNVSDRNLRAIVRLHDSADAARVAAAARTVGRELETEIPARYGMRNVSGPLNMVPLRDIVVGNVRTILLLLFAGVSLVVVIACANVASLILVRHEARRHEIVLRAALGGSRLRLIQLAATESLVLTFGAAALAVLLSWLGLQAFMSLAPPEFPRLGEVGMRPATILAAGGAALLIGCVFALLASVGPARIHTTHAPSLSGGVRGASAGRRARRFHRAVVAAQLALTLVLLASAGLLLRSLAALLNEDSGFDARGVVVGRLFLASSNHTTAEGVSAFFQRLEAAVAALPGVRAAGATNTLPMSGGWNNLSYRVEGSALEDSEQPPTADHQTVTAGYFRALAISLRRGRLFTNADSDGPPVVVVSEALARTAWPDGEALGRRLHLGSRTAEPHTVVGVVGDVLHHGPANPPAPTVYFPNRALPWGDAVRGMHLVVRAEGDALSVLPGVRRAIAELDPQLPLARVGTMEDVVAAATARPRLVTFLLAAFAAAGLVIAGAGVFGVFAYTGQRRIREIGIRIALGAEPARVRRGMLIEALGLVGMATVAGGILFALSSALIRSLLHGVGPFDPLILTAAAGAMTATGIAASYWPAVKASRTDPGLCLRQE